MCIRDRYWRGRRRNFNVSHLNHIKDNESTDTRTKEQKGNGNSRHIKESTFVVRACDDNGG